MVIKRRKQLKPLSNEHQQALLAAFQLKKGLAGHGDSAGAPKDLPGLLALAKRYEATVLIPHTRAEEELLGRFLSAPDHKRLRSEHAELTRLLEAAARGQATDVRRALTAFADLLERHVRWEERELFPSCEKAMDEVDLAKVGHELEKRLVLSRNDTKTAKRT